MSNMHVLESPGGAYRIVCHFPVANANNSAGVNWRTAMQRSLGGAARPSPSLLLDGDGTGGTISSAEKTQVIACEVTERLLHFTPPGNWSSMNPAAKAAALNSWYTAEQTKLQAQVVDALDEFGRTL